MGHCRIKSYSVFRPCSLSVSPIIFYFLTFSYSFVLSLFFVRCHSFSKHESRRRLLRARKIWKGRQKGKRIDDDGDDDDEIAMVVFYFYTQKPV